MLNKCNFKVLNESNNKYMFRPNRVLTYLRLDK